MSRPVPPGPASAPPAAPPWPDRRHHRRGRSRRSCRRRRRPRAQAATRRGPAGGADPAVVARRERAPGTPATAAVSLVDRTAATATAPGDDQRDLTLRRRERGHRGGTPAATTPGGAQSSATTTAADAAVATRDAVTGRTRTTDCHVDGGVGCTGTRAVIEAPGPPAPDTAAAPTPLVVIFLAVPPWAPSTLIVMKQMSAGTVPAAPNPAWSKEKNVTGAADADVTPTTSAPLVASVTTAIGVTHRRIVDRRIGRSVRSAGPEREQSTRGSPPVASGRAGSREAGAPLTCVLRSRAAGI